MSPTKLFATCVSSNISVRLYILSLMRAVEDELPYGDSTLHSESEGFQKYATVMNVLRDSRTVNSPGIVYR